MARKTKFGNQKFQLMDFILIVILTVWGLAIFLPFLNVIAVSFTSYKEYLETPLLLFPKRIDLQSYQELFKTGRIWTGYKTTLLYVAFGVPLALFLCCSTAYALCRRGYPGRKLIFTLILITMIFNGGIVPLYLVVKSLNLNNVAGVILVGGMNTFYMILMYNYFSSLPESLMESARLDGAGEWTILFRIVLPLSMPIIATVILFASVDRWNEWFNSMIFLRGNDWQPLQLVLRSIVIDSQVAADMSAQVTIEEKAFSNGIKMAAVMVTMLPIMCVFPFLQKHFAKGVMIGAIKS